MNVTSFPFTIIEPDKLISGTTYYIQLKPYVLNKIINLRRPMPVSRLKGTFVRLEMDNTASTTVMHALFKNVELLTKKYKNGSCTLFRVLYHDNVLGATGCDTYSDLNKERKINENREVWFSTNQWQFGLPSETNIITNKTIRKLETKLNDDTLKHFSSLLGKGGKKTNKKTNKRKNKKTNKKQTKRH
jgi:hypothetical protein